MTTDYVLARPWPLMPLPHHSRSLPHSHDRAPLPPKRGDHKCMASQSSGIPGPHLALRVGPTGGPSVTCTVCRTGWVSLSEMIPPTHPPPECKSSQQSCGLC